MLPSRAPSRARTGRRTTAAVCALLALGVTTDGIAAAAAPRPHDLPGARPVLSWPAVSGPAVPGSTGSGSTVTGPVVTRAALDPALVAGRGAEVAFDEQEAENARTDGGSRDVHHTKVGLWFDGPMSDVKVTNNVIVDQIADALNFHTGVTGSEVRNNFVRNTGDDGLAMWSDGTADAGNTFARNTVQSPTLANGIAIYGGQDNTVSGNLVADPVREGSGLHAGSRFGSEPFTGTLRFTDNTTVRAGTLPS